MGRVWEATLPPPPGEDKNVSPLGLGQRVALLKGGEPGGPLSAGGRGAMR